MFEFLFVGSLFLIFYSYIGYPLSVLLGIYLIGSNEVKQGPYMPKVTLIITAHNEERRIEEKLMNTILLEYPKEKLQTIVASDGSTDGTNDIVLRYEKDSIDLLNIPWRHGKENAQRTALQRASGEVIVFSDVATMLDPDGLKQIVSNFTDPTVGCVSSEDRFLDKEGKPAGEGLYVRYEMWVRRIESRMNSLVGLSGSFFAARKEVCEDFSSDMQSDFRTLLNSVKLGLRGVTDAKAIGYYEDVADETREFDRKIRTVIRGLTVFFSHLEFLNVSKYGLFSYQFFCHKLLRWLVPIFLIIAFYSNVMLMFASPLYFSLIILQLLFYGLAACGKWKGASWIGCLTRIPAFFVTVNVAILVAWLRFLRGERITMWAPSKR